MIRSILLPWFIASECFLLCALPGRAPFERGEFVQAAIDVLAIAFALLFVCITGVGIAAAFFFLFFVNC